MKTTYYFDNAATTYPKPEKVYVAMDSFYRECGVNVGRGQHKLASMASHRVEETRSLLLDFFNCPNRQVVFTHSATEALNLVIRNVITSKINVYISPFEHNAVTRTLFQLEKTLGCNVFVLPYDLENWTYDFDRMKHMFAENNPDVLIISHASNVCGAISPYQTIFSLAKKYNAITILDACQTAGVVDICLSDGIVDYLIFDGHKTLYGPLGIGGVIGCSFSTFKPLI